MGKQHIILVALLMSPNIYPQHLDWSYSIGGNRDDRCFDMEISNTGNICLTGGICNWVDFDLKGNSTIVSAQGTNMSDIFVAIYHSNLDLVNAFTLNSEEWNYATDLETDESNNIYISGYYYGTVDFDPSQDEYKLSAPETIFFIAKYDSTGVFKWAKRIFEKNDPYLGLIGSVMFSDENSNIYLSTPDSLRKVDKDGRNIWSVPADGLAEYDGTSNFYILSCNTTPYFPETNDRLFLTKIDTSGSVLFAKEIITNSSDGISGRLFYDKSGNLLISGMFWGNCAFKGGDNTINMTNNKTYCCLPRDACGDCPSYNGYLAKFDTAGNIIWVCDFGDNAPNPRIIETKSDGTIFTLGFLNFSADFDPAEKNKQLINNGYGHYVAKYDESGDFLAAIKFMGGSYNDNIERFKIIDDSIAYICGHFFNTINLDLSGGTSTLYASPPEDIFMAKYSDFDIHDFTIESVQEPVSEPGVVVYPNPTQGHIFIQHDAGSIKTVSVRNMHGQTVVTINEYDGDPIDLSFLPEGVYVICIDAMDALHVEKIIKL